MTTPSIADIKKFLMALDSLSSFESDHRTRCGWGAFDESRDELPVPEIVTIQTWLQEIIEKEESVPNEAYSPSNWFPYRY